jgi:hypothetical protein
MTISYATYCIIDSDCEMPEGIAGLQAGAVWNLPYRQIGVVASVLTAPIHDIVAGAVEHEAVVERLMRTFTVLPMRFPTIFAGPEAVLGMVARHYDGFREDLRRLHNHVEFGLRVLWPSGATGTEGAETLAGHGCEGPTQDTVKSSGTLYLQQRCRQHVGRRAQWERAARLAHDLDLALSVLATEKRLRRLTAEGFAFDGVYLVNKDEEAGFRRAFAAARSMEPDFRYLFSGPWPPYNFVTMPGASKQRAVPATGAVANDLIRYLGLVGSRRDA